MDGLIFTACPPTILLLIQHLAFLIHFVIQCNLLPTVLGKSCPLFSSYNMTDSCFQFALLTCDDLLAIAC